MDQTDVQLNEDETEQFMSRHSKETEGGEVQQRSQPAQLFDYFSDEQALGIGGGLTAASFIGGLIVATDTVWATGMASLGPMIPLLVIATIFGSIAFFVAVGEEHLQSFRSIVPIALLACMIIPFFAAAGLTLPFNDYYFEQTHGEAIKKKADALREARQDGLKPDDYTLGELVNRGYMSEQTCSSLVRAGHDDVLYCGTKQNEPIVEARHSRELSKEPFANYNVHVGVDYHQASKQPMLILTGDFGKGQEALKHYTQRHDLTRLGHSKREDGYDIFYLALN